MGNDCLERFKMDEEASSSRCQIRECIGFGSDYSWSSSTAWTVRAGESGKDLPKLPSSPIFSNY